MTLRWFISRAVRDAVFLKRRVLRLLRAQEDQLKPEAAVAVRESASNLQAALREGADRGVIRKRMEELEQVARRRLLPYPHAGMRENVDVVLVALVVALGVRTFFLQPMAIPTGSMQPTLYGITHVNLLEHEEMGVPNVFVRVFEKAFLGISYHREKVAEDGVFLGWEKPQVVMPFVKKQAYVMEHASGRKRHVVWFPPEELPARVEVGKGDVFKEGQFLYKLRVKSGDRLFVDRLTYNFRRPERGEIIIFESTNIPALTQNTHYIKRLIGLPGEEIRIGNDRRVIVDGERLDAATPRFEYLYTFEGPPRMNEYSGHVNLKVGERYGMTSAALFPYEEAGVKVREGHYLVMGDNTMNSYDSRAWGDFPQEKVVGKCSFVFWPISDRFGWGFR